MKLPKVIDCHYLFPQYAASFLLEEGGRAAFIEANTSRAVPFLLAKLRENKLSTKDVEWIIITHVHLDHAGGCSELLAQCPQATLLAHPKAALHIIDPSKLVKSARQVYGEKTFEELYGEVLPVPSERVRIMQDGEKISWGDRHFTFFYTKGHANHHFCIHDSDTNGVFTGDSFGIAYPYLQKQGLFIFPSTSPTDFDPIAAKETVQRVLKMQPGFLFLTHFGAVTQIDDAADQMMKHLDLSEALLNKGIASSLTREELTEVCLAELKKYFSECLEARGMASDSLAWRMLQGDIELNAAGIAHTAIRSRKQN